MPHSHAVVERGLGFAIARFPYPVLNNAVLLDRGRLEQVVRAYGDEVPYAIWTPIQDTETASMLEGAGFQRDEVTTPMVLDLAGRLPPAESAVPMRREATSDDISELNGTEPKLLRDVPGLRPYLTESGELAWSPSMSATMSTFLGSSQQHMLDVAGWRWLH